MVVTTRRSGNGTVLDNPQPKTEINNNLSTPRSLRSISVECSKETDESIALSNEISSSRLRKSKRKDSINLSEDIADISKVLCNGSTYNGISPEKNCVLETVFQKRLSHEQSPSYKNCKVSQANADLSKKKKEVLSHHRSLRSLGLEEDGSSCEEEDGIGALASVSHHLSNSHESFPSMFLRRSSRNRKTIYSTLNVSTIEHAAMLSDELDQEEISCYNNEKRQKKKTIIKPELRDLLVAQGKDPEDIADISQPDIYNSIKSRKRLRRPRRFFDEDDIETSIPNGPLENSEEDEVLEEEHENEDDADGDEENVEEGEGDNDVPTDRRYSLRTKRAQPLRLVYGIQHRSRQPAPRGIFDHLPTSSVHRRRSHPRSTQQPGSPYQFKRRRNNAQGSSSTSTSDDDDDDERKFEKRKKKSMMKIRNRCLPMNLTLNELATHGLAKERQKIGSSLADVDPMMVDKTIKFDSVGGQEKHIRALKEMIVFPLLYPEVFQKFHINPPRGCLFYGPPGTGKTLMARALANECSSENRKVAFFMRKGADCLSKWVGESERQLRLLFDQAYQLRPSIIFFDEIDGLAPVRSSRQDQIHSSIVSTLLGLMDGLDNRGEIIVIGATNRIDSIDPALRRPGRFDREFSFQLPDKIARKEILMIHTKKWHPAISDCLIDELAEKSAGYCGADIMRLCGESGLFALRRRYPQIYETSEKLKLDIDSINIGVCDFHKAMQNIVPTAQRTDASPGRSLLKSIHPLLFNALVKALTQLAKVFPLVHKKSKILQVSLPNLTSIALTEGNNSHSPELNNSDSEFEEERPGERDIVLPPNGISIHRSLLPGMSSNAYRDFTVHRPRYLICGSPEDGQTTHVAPAILHDLEGLPVHLLDIPTLYGTSVRSPEEACAQIFREARRTAPSIIYFPNAILWWESSSETVHHTFEALLKSFPASSPVVLIATVDCSYNEVPESLSKFFSERLKEVFSMVTPTVEERTAFFAPIFLQFAIKPPVYQLEKQMRSVEVLEKAPIEPPAALTEQELAKLNRDEENVMRNLRLFLRDVLTRLARDRRFKVFLKPVDIEEVPDYTDVIANPMDISTMMNKIDQHKYNNVSSFLLDTDLICDNALEYNPDHCAEDKAIRHRACLLKDIARAIVQEDLDPNFEKLCNEVTESRLKRKADPLKFAPSYFNVLPPQLPSSKSKKTASAIAKVPVSVESKSCDEPVQSTHRKKRRRSVWASGVVKRRKFKKKPKIEEENEETEKCNKDEEFSDELKLDEIDQENSNKAEETRLSDFDADNVSLNVVEDVCNLIGPSGDATTISGEVGTKCEDNNVAEPIPNLKGSPTSLDTTTACMDTPAEDDTFAVQSGDAHPIEEAQEISKDMIDTDVIELTAESNMESSLCSNVEDDQEGNESEVVEPLTESPMETPESSCGMTLRPRTRSSYAERESGPALKLPPPPPLVVDMEKLQDLLRFTVQNTLSLRVEELESLYSILARIIYLHRHSYDKTLLTEELGAEVKTFTSGKH